MEPLTTALIAAITAGVISGGTKVIELAITDAYVSLKNLLVSKFGEKGKVVEAVNLLETDPNFEPYQDAVAQRAKEVQLYKDIEVMQALNHLLEELGKHKGALQAAGIDMQKVDAASIQINDVISSGTGVKMADIKVKDGITISKIRSGHKPDEK